MSKKILANKDQRVLFISIVEVLEYTMSTDKN